MRHLRIRVLRQEAAESAEAAAKTPMGIAAVPDDSPLAKISVGMSDVEVRKALGEPTTQNSYTAGKS